MRLPLHDSLGEWGYPYMMFWVNRVTPAWCINEIKYAKLERMLDEPARPILNPLKEKFTRSFLLLALCKTSIPTTLLVSSLCLGTSSNLAFSESCHYFLQNYFIWTICSHVFSVSQHGQLSPQCPDKLPLAFSTVRRRREYISGENRYMIYLVDVGGNISFPAPGMNLWHGNSVICFCDRDLTRGKLRCTNSTTWAHDELWLHADCQENCL